MHGLRPSFVCLAIVVLASGCPTRPAGGLSGFDCDSKTGVCSPRDGGSSSGDGPDGAGGDGGGATIAITDPVSPAYTNGAIDIQIAFAPPSAAPASADLFDGDTRLGGVTSPFRFTWNTGGATPAAEGPHQITARAVIGGQTISSAPVTINVDRTVPEITNRSPASGATNVLFADPIQIVFSEALDPATVSGAVTLSSGAGAIATTASLGADGKTVTVSLSDRHAVALPADVTVSVKATVADLAGNQVGPVATWSWNAPVWVKLPMLAGQYPALAMGGDDRPLILNAVEQDAIGSNDFILQLARLGPTRAWDTSVPSPQGARPAARVSSRPALAVGSDGLPVIAWPEAQGSTPLAMHVARWSGTAWDKSFGMLDAVAGAGTDTYNPALAFSPAGELFVSWAEPNPTAFAVFTAKWTGTSWDTSYGDLGVIGANAPSIRFGTDGRPLVAFNTSVTTSTVTRWTGTAWMLLPSYTSSTSSAALAIDPSGRPVVLSIAGSTTDQYARLYFFNSTSWVEEIPAAPTGLQARDAQLVIPADGHPVIAWSEYDMTAAARVVRVSRHNGMQWDFAYGSLDGRAGTNTDGAVYGLVLDRGGSPIVAWQETDGTRLSTYVWRSNR
jgi:hypothetical protein